MYSSLWTRWTFLKKSPISSQNLATLIIHQNSCNCKYELLNEQQSNVIQVLLPPAESHSCLAYLIPARLQPCIYHAWHTLHILGWPHRVMAVHGVDREADAEDDEMNHFQIWLSKVRIYQLRFWGTFLAFAGRDVELKMWMIGEAATGVIDCCGMS